MKRAICLTVVVSVLSASPALAAKKPVGWKEFKANRIQEAAPNRLMIPKLLPAVIDEARAKYREWQEAWHNHLRYKREPIPSEVQTTPEVSSSLYATGSFAIPTYIVMCESGGNYLAENAVSSASGAYQIVDGSWAGYGGYSHASDAPPSVQDAKAALMWAGGAGASHWAACL